MQQKKMTAEQFELLAQLTRAREPVKTAARRVLLDGIAPADAARETKLSPQSVSNALRRYRKFDADGEVDTVVLGVHDEDWCEAGDWKAESISDSVHAGGGWIVGWMPYSMPLAVLAKTPPQTDRKMP